MAQVPHTPLPTEQLHALVADMAAARTAEHTYKLRRALEIIATLNEKTTTVEHARTIAKNCLESLEK